MSPTRRISDIHATLAIVKTANVGREEYLDHMTFRVNTRPLFTEPFGPIVGLKEEWASQGATPDEINMSAFCYRHPAEGRIPVHTGWLGGPEEEILAETDAEIIARDRYGRRVKLPKGFATIALPLDYPVRTMDDWLKLKHHYEFSEERFAPGWEEIAREHLAVGRIVSIAIPGGFDEARELMGDAEVCMAYYTQPELIRDILQTIGDTAYRVLDRVSATVQVDQLTVHEDMAGRAGPLIGPRQMRQFVVPYYRRIWDLLRGRGARLFWIDSDGDITPILPQLIEGGINVIFPVEPVGGMDIVKLREQYGAQLAFIGGLDKHVLRRSREEIVAELEYKIPPMVRSGACMLGLDHRIPNGTPIAAYRFYHAKAWEILERETAKPHA